MIEFNVPYDIAGLSFYPSYTGPERPSLESLEQSIEMINALDKKVLICEYGYPSSPSIQDPIMDGPVDGYPLTPDGQASFVEDFLSWCYIQPNIVGAFYFYPDNFLSETDPDIHGAPHTSLFYNDSTMKPALESISELSRASARVREIPEPEPEPEEQALGTLRIRVYNETRAPLSGVTVYSSSQPEGQSSLEGTTSSDGEVTFEDVIAGEYFIKAMKQEYESSISIGGVALGDTLELVFYLEETETEPEPEPSPASSPEPSISPSPTPEPEQGGIPGFPTQAVVLGVLLSLFILKKIQS